MLKSDFLAQTNMLQLMIFTVEKIITVETALNDLSPEQGKQAKPCRLNVFPATGFNAG